MADELDGDATEMKILLATDIHLGFNENHPIRGDDSFITFEEILKIGVKHKVDFVLLGGDLFHDGKPSVNCYSKCMELLKRYCMGDGEVKINVLSDPAEIFSFSANPMVNFMNPNLNVALPVFSIHGNHDDPLGFNSKCSLDMLSAAGMINYFGKYTNLEKSIEMVPLLISKGETKLAIYGLGALKDKLAARLFRTEKVELLQPKDAKEWFNIMVVHQNRNAHTKDECLQESYLPASMHLIFWGHEHECRIVPEFNNTKNFFVTQPGSSVATSLCEAESQQKQVGILHVRGTKFQIRPIPLKTVRPFVFDTVNLATEYRDIPARTMNKGVQAFLEQKVEEMLEEAAKQITGHKKQPTLPLLRLRVEFQRQEELFNTVRFGLPFENRVANHTDMIDMKRPKGPRRERTELDEDALESARTNSVLHNVEELVEKYFADCEPGKRMHVLPVAALNEALTQQMKGDKVAFDIVLNKLMEKTVKSIVEKDLIEADDIREEFEVMRDTERPANNDQMIQEVLEMLRDAPRDASAVEAVDDGSDNENSFASPTVANGRGRGRGSGSRARGRGRGTNGRSVDDSNGEAMDDSDAPPARPARGPGSRGGRGSRSRAAKAKQPARAEASPALNITRTRVAPSSSRISHFLSDDDNSD